MTKKHFIALAGALKATMPKPEQYDVATKTGSIAYLDARAQWQRDARIVAQVCLEHNARFDWRVFMSACGMTEGL